MNFKMVFILYIEILLLNKDKIMRHVSNFPQHCHNICCKSQEKSNVEKKYYFLQTQKKLDFKGLTLITTL